MSRRYTSKKREGKPVLFLIEFYTTPLLEKEGSGGQIRMINFGYTDISGKKVPEIF